MNNHKFRVHYGIEDIIFKYNSMSKIKKITCYFLKFIAYTTNGITSEESKTKIRLKFFAKAFLEEPLGQYPGTFNTFQMEQATNFHVREAQKRAFEEEYLSLTLKQQIKDTSTLIKLNPFFNENEVICMNSRLDHHHAYQDQLIKPVILPKEERITELIVLEVH